MGGFHLLTTRKASRRSATAASAAPHTLALARAVSSRHAAGSERIGRSEVAGQALKEAQSINKSLSALGDVVCAMQASAKHIPFRNSRLTQARARGTCSKSIESSL